MFGRHPAVKIFVGKGKGTVDKITENIRQFIIMPRLKIFPRKIHIARFGHIACQYVAQRIRMEFFQIVIEPDRVIAAGGQFVAFEIEKFVGRHIIRQYVLAVRHKHGRENDAVKYNIIFSDEMDKTGFFVLPVRFPPFGVAGLSGPFFGGRNIPNGRVEPDIQHFAFGFHAVFTGDILRYFHSPGQVAGYGAVVESGAEPAFNLPEHIAFPFRVRFNPGFQCMLIFGKRQVPVNGFFVFRRGVGNGAARIFKFFGAQRGTAFFALVAVSVVVTAHGAGAAHKAVSQKNTGFRVVQLLFFFKNKFVLFSQGAEKILTGFVMHRRGSAAVIIEAHTKIGKALFVQFVVAVNHNLRRNAFFARPQHNGYAVFIGTADVNNVRAFQTVVAYKDICRKIGAGKMSQMDGAVGIRQSAGNKNAFRQEQLLKNR